MRLRRRPSSARHTTNSAAPTAAMDMRAMHTRVGAHVSIACMAASVMLAVLCAASHPVHGVLQKGAQSYSDDVARLYLNYATAAYCPSSKLQPWSCNLPVCADHPHVNSTVVDAPKLNIQAFVAYDPDAPAVWVSFRGTSPLSLKDWLDDLDFTKVSYDACSSQGCKVHKGFLQSFQSVKDRILALVQLHTTAHPGVPVHVTGHSLGAALAELAALALAENGTPADEVLTFGCPRLGNSAFADYFKSKITVAHFRVTHNADPVPHLPPESFGFHHAPTEVFYNEFNTKWTVCDGSGEDHSCADGVLLPVNLVDHVTYLGLNLTENFLKVRRPAR